MSVMLTSNGFEFSLPFWVKSVSSINRHFSPLSSWELSAHPHLNLITICMSVRQLSTPPYHLTQYSQRHSTMDHHKEERTDLLPPSGSNDDPFPVTCSEAGHSSSSATLVEPLPTARRIRLGSTPGVIAGLLFGAALTAALHHFYLFILRGRTVSSQFWIKNSSNALSTLVQWLCMGSVSVSLSQVVSISYSDLKPSIHRLSRSGGCYVADRSLSFNSTIYLVYLILFEFCASPLPEESEMLFLLSSLQQFSKHLRSYPYLLPTLSKLAQRRPKTPLSPYPQLSSINPFTL